MSPVRLNILFVAIVTVITGAFTAGFVIPGIRELNQCRREVNEAADRTRQAQVTSAEESTVYQAIMDLQCELAESRRHVPSERQFGEFLNSVSESLRDLGVSNYELRPLSEYALATTTETAAFAGKAFVLPVRLKISCSFKTTFDFLTRLSEMPRLARVSAIEINAANSRSPRVDVRMLIETYYCPESANALDAPAQEVRS